MCDKFDATWKGCMRDNTSKWEEIMATVKSCEETRDTVRGRNTQQPSKIGKVQNRLTVEPTVSLGRIRRRFLEDVPTFVPQIWEYDMF